jgi:hypothetical protein
LREGAVEKLEPAFAGVTASPATALHRADLLGDLHGALGHEKCSRSIMRPSTTMTPLLALWGSPNVR